jgi:hypothetical protein
MRWVTRWQHTLGRVQRTLQRTVRVGGLVSHPIVLDEGDGQWVWADLVDAAAGGPLVV